jgi:hypothetical protein
MRFVLVPLLGALLATPALAQPYGYAERSTAWSAARNEWQRAHRAEDIARWRAANGDYEGADRAQYWADQHRQRARENADVARGGW